jgi:hypothetical protein
MEHPLRGRDYCLERLRAYQDVHDWFASYALYHLAVEADLRILNEVVDALGNLVDNPEAIGNEEVEAIVRQRFLF